MILSFSCVSPVKVFNDNVKKTTIYSWVQTKIVRSKMYNIQNNFTVDLKKYGKTDDRIVFQIESSYPVINAAYTDTAYFVIGGKIISIPFLSIDDIRYKEQINSINSTTNTNVVVETNSSSNTEPVISSNTENRAAVVKETQTTTTSTTKTDTDVKTEILDKVYSKRVLMILPEDLRLVSKQFHAKLRIYNKKNDYWDINFNTTDLEKIKILLNNTYDIKA